MKAGLGQQPMARHKHTTCLCSDLHDKHDSTELPHCAQSCWCNGAQSEGLGPPRPIQLAAAHQPASTGSLLGHFNHLCDQPHQPSDNHQTGLLGPGTWGGPKGYMGQEGYGEPTKAYMNPGMCCRISTGLRQRTWGKHGRLSLTHMGRYSNWRPPDSNRRHLIQEKQTKRMNHGQPGEGCQVHPSSPCRARPSHHPPAAPWRTLHMLAAVASSRPSSFYQTSNPTPASLAPPPPTGNLAATSAIFDAWRGPGPFRLEHNLASSNRLPAQETPVYETLIMSLLFVLQLVSPSIDCSVLQGLMKKRLLPGSTASWLGGPVGGPHVKENAAAGAGAAGQLLYGPAQCDGDDASLGPPLLLRAASSPMPTALGAAVTLAFPSYPGPIGSSGTPPADKPPPHPLAGQISVSGRLDSAPWCSSLSQQQSRGLTATPQMGGSNPDDAMTNSQDPRLGVAHPDSGLTSSRTFLWA
ncbi:zinc finger MIZ domain-containing protein 2-like protein [Lates japonicus]|uniref:Zinc finger MIZ domain-containing protein 2-like protein n=1 Tax=Lates japonicus TaxID=270547 RepID=A0AAD3NJ12_LATJO|nr:zinc finger MIZ domain-containing protein 2-like protein [Lates japonicus]